MKKVISAIILFGISSTAMAEAAGGPGCGWGQAVFKGQSGTGPHVMAATTNGILGNNTFGMTSGTGGCSTDGTLTYGDESMASLLPVMDEFSEDVARGQGDALDAVAVVIGIEQADRETFRQVMHENFTTIFPHANVTAKEVMHSLNEVMKNDERLSKYAV